MALSDLYVLMQGLQQPILDKNTGLPLAGGTLNFYEDNSRNTRKNVYELTGSPPNYTYSPLPNAMTLSTIGTPMDAAGNPTAIYYKPYDDAGNPQLYYITVYDSLGNFQYSLEAWPNQPLANEPTNEAVSYGTNLLSNPQFAFVNFNPSFGVTIAASGSTSVAIAPGWTLLAAGTGTIIVNQTSVTGSAGFATNPAYQLTIAASGSLTSLQLSQTLNNNPNVWYANGENMGYVATSVSFGNNGTVSIDYVPSIGPIENLLEKTNNTGSFLTYYNTAQLTNPENTANSITGYANIVVTLPTTGTINITSLQCISMATDLSPVAYDQQPVNRQLDYLGHYYIPRLAYKPIRSYLIGWDFPVNPAQIFAASGIVNLQALGANSSFYAWDQLILYQSITNGVSVSRGTYGELVLTTANPASIAMIQYLGATEAKRIFSDRISCCVTGSTTQTGGITGTVSLWACSDSALPVLAASTYKSIVATLNATGGVATRNGTWTECPRNGLGEALFTLGAASSTNSEANDIDLSGWDFAGNAAVANATFFAIVVGFAPTVANATITMRSIGLCPGDIPSRPAPQTPVEVQTDCEKYYEKSYTTNTLAGTESTVGQLTIGMDASVPNAGSPYASFIQETAFSFQFATPKRIPATQGFPTVTLYSPQTGASGNVSEVIRGTGSTVNDALVTTVWGTAIIGDKNASYQVVGGTSTAWNASGPLTPLITYINFHYVADARLGLVA